MTLYTTVNVASPPATPSATRRQTRQRLLTITILLKLALSSRSVFVARERV